MDWVSVGDHFGMFPIPSQTWYHPLNQVVKAPDFKNFGISIQGEVDGLKCFPSSIMNFEFQFHDRNVENVLEQKREI